MKDKIITIYDNYYSEEKEESTREFLFNLYADEEGWKTADDIPENRVFDQMSHEDSTDWQDVERELSRLFNTHCYLLTGYCGTWRGNLDGGNFIHSINDFLRVIEHLDNIRISDKNGHLIIEGSHHDGSDRYELKRLTNKGYLLAENNYFAKDRQLHSTIMNNNFYSALPRFAKTVYGV